MWRSTALVVAVWVAASASTVQAGINIWTRHGPFGSLVSALALDPSNPNTLYAATTGGGVFKSIDGGEVWSVTGLTDVIVYALSIDHIMPATLYAGTDKAVFKSTNGGDIWEALDLGGGETGIVSAIVIDPVTPSTLYAGADGLFKSTNYGDTWKALNLDLALFLSVAIDSANPATLYAGGLLGGLARSTDRGATWSNLDPSLPFLAGLLVMDPTAPGTLYSGGPTICRGLHCSKLGLFKSTDDGVTWDATGLSDDWVRSLVIDSVAPSTLYAGTDDGVFKSSNAGSTWAAFGTGLANSSVTSLAIDPKGSGTLYAGTSAGEVFDIHRGECRDGCQSDGHATVDGLLALVSIALEKAAPAICPEVASGGTADIVLIIRAVNNTLSVCGE